MDGNLSRSLMMFVIGLIGTRMGFGVFSAKHAEDPKTRRLRWIGPMAMGLAVMLYFVRKMQ